jgi:hypothetical protein
LDIRRLHNEELCKLYTSSNIVRVIKSIDVRWARHVAHMRTMTNAYKTFVGMRGNSHSEDLDFDGKIILEWILGK